MTKFNYDRFANFENIIQYIPACARDWKTFIVVDPADKIQWQVVAWDTKPVRDIPLEKLQAEFLEFLHRVIIPEKPKEPDPPKKKTCRVYCAHRWQD